MCRRVIAGALALSYLALPLAAQPKQHLPVVLYNHGVESSPYQFCFIGPISYMKKNDLARVDNRTCMMVNVNIISSWGGVFWNYHPTEPDAAKLGLNLAGAKKLTFTARGAKGGEKLTATYGISGTRVNNDTSNGSMNVVLTPRWKTYTFDLKGKNLSMIRNGLRITTITGHQPASFYLDNVRFE